MFALACAGAAPAVADDVDGEDRRLDDLIFIVKAFDRGYEPLIRDAEAVVESAGDGAHVKILRGLRDQAWVLQAERVSRPGKAADEKRALELWDRLSKEAEDPQLKERGDKQAFELEFAQAEALDDGKPENDELALTAYRSAARRRSADARPFQKIGGIGLRHGKRLEQRQQWDLALSSYKDSDDAISQQLAATDPARQAFASAIDRILGSTGVLRYDWIGDAEQLARVPGFRDFQAGDLQLEPTAGQAPPKSRFSLADGSARVLAGAYRGTVVVGGRPGLSGLSVDVRATKQAAGGTPLVLPVGVPDGMVYVPPTSGMDAFLIDRVEVTRGDFEQWAGSANVAFLREGDPNTPARGMNHRAAASYARSLGKALPTEQQWKFAAYGPATRSERPYPWGRQVGQHRRHFHSDLAADGPGLVTDCPDGKSAFGLLNMAGNVWEWLDNGWCIGGGFTTEDATFVLTGIKYENESRFWDPNMLWDPAPGPAAYGRLEGDPWKQYAGYSVSEETLVKVGLRCVIPLLRR